MVYFLLLLKKTTLRFRNSKERLAQQRQFSKRTTHEGQQNEIRALFIFIPGSHRQRKHHFFSF